MECKEFPSPEKVLIFAPTATKGKKKGLQIESPMNIYSADELVNWVLRPEQVTVEWPKNVLALFWNFIIIIKIILHCKMQHIIRDATLADANLEENLSVSQMSETQI